VTQLSELLMLQQVRDIGVISQFPPSEMKKLNESMLGDLAFDIPNQDSIQEALNIISANPTREALLAHSNKILRNGVYGIFMDDTEEKFDREFLKDYVNVLVGKGKKLFFRALFTVYRERFDEKSWVTKILADALRHMIHLASDNARNAIEDYKLLDISHVSSVLGKEILETNDPKSWLVDTLGLINPVAAYGLSLAALKGTMSELTERNYELNEPIVKKIQSWVTHDNNYEFGEKCELVIDGMLLPCGNMTLDVNTKKCIENFLLKVFKDPRFLKNRNTWLHVSEDAKKLFLGWLTKSSLDVFLRIIDDAAYATHWKHRREFWSRYIDGNYVDEAYVVLGPISIGMANRLYQETKDEAYKCCGEILNPSLKDHSVLLLKMGNIVVSEGSHQKKVHVWNNNKNAPEFYENEYVRFKLESKSDFNTHHDIYGRWREKVGDFIKTNSGNRIPDLS